MTSPQTPERIYLDQPTGCAMTTALEVIGGKWKGIILYHLRDDKKRFNALSRLMPHITQRMLTRQLRELETDGVILRTVYPQVPPKVEYELTTLGHTLVPVIQVLTDWGRLYEAQYPEHPRFKVTHDPHSGC
jgi:DNA-binding HxlR family transcriptional regulator